MKSAKVSSMNRIRMVLCCAMLLAAIAGYQHAVGAQSQPRALITEPVIETDLVTLAGNTRPEATAANDRGPVAADLPMDNLLLQLRRAPEQEQAVQKYIDGLTDPKSPNFHHWLSAREVGNRYGLAAQDLATIKHWLESHGFTINQVYPNRMVIGFSGNAGQVQEAFHTEIHNLNVNGKARIANMSDPQIPAALAPAVVGVVSLNNFPDEPQYHVNPDYTYGCTKGLTTTCTFVSPADLATIYNLNPLFSAGISGQGQTIVVAEPTDVYSAGDFSTFRTRYGLTAFPEGSFTTVHPGNCADPGVVAGPNEAEAILDVEWASAAAPSATIELVSCKGVNQLGALQNLLNADSMNTPAVVSISYGVAEAKFGAANNAEVNSLYQTAVLDGVSIFVAAGDQAAATNDAGKSAASSGIGVNTEASTQYNVAVGGTDFGDTFAGTIGTYWSSTNSPTRESALSYVPEIPWNNSCGSELIAEALTGSTTTFGSSGLCNTIETDVYQLLNVSGGGGGPSGCATGAPSTPGVVSGTCAGYPKPAWQSVLGNPADGVRDLPDVALFASDGPIWGHSYIFCDSDPADGGPANPCILNGGTSFAAPIMAGIQALINQHTGSRQGNPNPTYYALADAEYGTTGSASCNSTLGNAVASTCIFHDVTQGDMDVPCTGTNNCYDPSGIYGVLSTSNSAFEPAYPATLGWDFATGIGSVNAYNLVMAFGSSVATPTPTATPTATATATPTPTATASTPTATATATSSATATNTATATAATPTATPTATSTATSTATPTATGTPTATATPTPTSTPTGVPESLAVKPPFKNFGTVTPGKTKKAKFTLSNPAKSGPPITFGTPLASITNSAEFGGSTTCPVQLFPKKKCTIIVTFTPASQGPASSVITIFDDAANANQQIQLEGTGK